VGHKTRKSQRRIFSVASNNTEYPGYLLPFLGNPMHNGGLNAYIPVFYQTSDPQTITPFGRYVRTGTTVCPGRLRHRAGAVFRHAPAPIHLSHKTIKPSRFP
jgi:hypothetical protein